MGIYRVYESAWKAVYSQLRSDVSKNEGYDYSLGYSVALDLINSWITGDIAEPFTNRERLDNMSNVDLVNWIKNTAAAMSDAELMKWMEEEYHG